jgi:RNA polymerase-binding transcription factor DksA
MPGAADTVVSMLPDIARVRLQAERRRAMAEVTERLAQLEQVAAVAMTEGRDDEHDPDGATVVFEHSLAVGLLAQAEQAVAEVDLAIERLSAGVYGRCTRCGVTISDERLEARPTASTCVRCASPPQGLSAAPR